MSPSNLFEGLPSALPEELIETIVSAPAVRVERIVSLGHTSPEGFWYDQPTDEWVVLLTGAARLRLEGRAEVVEMIPGSHLNIPAHARHRVEWTDPERATVWLAVHYVA